MYTSAGNETCSSGGRTIPGKPGHHGVDGSWGHYEQDAKTYSDWGIDYVRPAHTAQIYSCLLTPLPQVKLDWCTKYKDKNELTTKFRQALDSSGRDMW